jgi:SHAQKYF class myb-like DNA-binding protein
MYNHQTNNAVATPKQIREMMKVDGLTNDEVKSHLQVIYAHFIRLNSILLLSFY